jgi:hypothetical protein
MMTEYSNSQVASVVRSFSSQFHGGKSGILSLAKGELLAFLNGFEFRSDFSLLSLSEMMAIYGSK